MKSIKKSAITSAITLGLSAVSSAQAGGIYDPRSLAMGGVGVTTATSRNASFFNPAALAATKETDDFAFNLTVAARAADPDKLADDIDDVETTSDNVSAALDRLNLSVDAIINAGGGLTQPQVDQGRDDAAAASTAITQFNNSLSRINRKNVELGAFGGVIVAIPSKSFGLGLFAAGQADVGARFDYASSDASQLATHAATASTISTTLAGCNVGVPATCNVDTLRDQVTNANGDLNNLNSTFNVRGAVVTEAGVSLARRFPDWGNVDIGITPKVIKVQTFNYSISAQDTEIDADKGKREGSSVNFDIGATKTYGDNYKAGLVIKNLIPKEFALAHPNQAQAALGQNASEKFKIKPQARLGVSHHTSWTTVGLDLDLNKRAGLGAGFSKDTQFLGVGAELDLSVIDLRVGYRHDLKGNYDGMPSVGLGVYVFGLHADLAVAGNDKEVAASFQLGLNF